MLSVSQSAMGRYQLGSARIEPESIGGPVDQWTCRGRYELTRSVSRNGDALRDHRGAPESAHGEAVRNHYHRSVIFRKAPALGGARLKRFAGMACLRAGGRPP